MKHHKSPLKIHQIHPDKQRMFSSVVRVTGSFLVIALTAITIISIMLIKQVDTLPTPTPIPRASQAPTQTADLKQECEIKGGIWLKNFNECEQISKEQCTELGGEFNECASACRNDPTADVCIEICVAVCEII